MDCFSRTDRIKEHDFYIWIFFSLCTITFGLYSVSCSSHKNETIGMLLIERISPHCLAIVVGIEKAEKLIKALLVLN